MFVGKEKSILNSSKTEFTNMNQIEAGNKILKISVRILDLHSFLVFIRIEKQTICIE